jgi:hypothetical protein
MATLTYIMQLFRGGCMYLGISKDTTRTIPNNHLKVYQISCSLANIWLERVKCARKILKIFPKYVFLTWFSERLLWEVTMLNQLSFLFILTNTVDYAKKKRDILTPWPTVIVWWINSSVIIDWHIKPNSISIYRLIFSFRFISGGQLQR